MPDEYVAVDTSGISEYFLKVRPLILRFALKYTDANRDKLKTFREPSDMKAFLERQSLLTQFVRYAAANGMKEDREGLKISGKIIHIQLEAYIARNILDNKGFYPIWEDIDTTLKYAISYLETHRSEVRNQIKGPITKN
jgi:carboxyl-terminal processing protease